MKILPINNIKYNAKTSSPNATIFQAPINQGQFSDSLSFEGKSKIQKPVRRMARRCERILFNPKAETTINEKVLKNGEKITFERFVETNRLKIKTHFYSDGSIKSTEEYSPLTGKVSVIKDYNETTKKLATLAKFNPKDGTIRTITNFDSNGKTLISRIEFNQKTGHVSKMVFYTRKNKQLMSNTTEYNPITGKQTKQTLRNENGKLIKEIQYKEDGETKLSVSQYNATTHKYEKIKY